MKNKHAFPVLIVLLIAAAAFLIAGRKENRNYLLASGHPQYPPFMWQEGDKIVGVGPEILSAACKKLGIPLKIEFAGSWDDVIKDARKGKIDAVVAIYRTDERKGYLEYSIPYAKDPVAVFVRKDKVFRYSKWTDLDFAERRTQYVVRASLTYTAILVPPLETQYAVSSPQTVDRPVARILLPFDSLAKLARSGQVPKPNLSKCLSRA